MSGHGSLIDDRIRVLDGGTGSELRRHGIALSDVCWSAAANLDRTELLEAIHRDYIEAGADIVTANTFATSRFVLAAAGLGDRCEAINRAAVGAARRAIETSSRSVSLAASLSCLPPGMDRAAYPSPAAESAAYAELAESFAASGVELILVEMLQHPGHAERACRAAAAVGLPFVAGLSCRLAPTRDTERLVAFDDPTSDFDELLAAVLAFAPDAIGIMHSPIEAMLPALDRLRACWTGNIAAYAELPYAEDPDVDAAALAALEEVPDGSAPASAPAAYAAEARTWIAGGATIVGGCCGTGPGHIAALRQLVDSGRPY